MDDWLLSPAPLERLSGVLAVFSPLIGSWSLEVENIAADGSVTRSDAEWHFDWALGGRAVVDVWISPARANRASPDDGEWGMSVRFYDEQLQTWRSTWHGPGRGWVIPFLAHEVDGGLRLEANHDGTPIRWTFSDIREDSFRWRAEHQQEDGSWQIRQTFAATRASTLA